MLAWLTPHHRRNASEQELRRSIHLAFRLANQSGRMVSVALQPGPRLLVPRLGKRTAIGIPEGMPLPPGILDPRWARVSRPLMVTPWHTATEGMWFLQDEGGPLCMHLTARGDLRFLRFRSPVRGWVEV